MKKVFLMAFLIAIGSLGFAQVQMPQPSPTQYIKQDFGMSSIELTYSRPGVKGRSIIGNLEPWDAVWRTGANAPTKIKFNDPVEIGGKKVDSGTYVLYTIPKKDGNWIVILNKGLNNWGADGYKESEDVLRTTVKSGNNPQKVETLTMQFSDVKPESCNLNIKWEDFSLQIPILTNIKDKVRAQFEAALQPDKKPYWQAAQFYNEYDKNYPKALEMINSALSQAKSPAYYMVYYKAVIQKNMGDKSGAMATSKQALQLAKDAKNAGYISLNEKLMKDLK
jgi:hypothetical protein